MKSKYKYNEGSDADLVKKAYHKLSLKHHPDKNPGDVEAEEKMVSISKANKILMDNQKKAIYDHWGSQEIFEWNFNLCMYRSFIRV